MQYHLRWCHVTAHLQVWWINLKSLFTPRFNNLIWHNYAPNEHRYADQYDPYANTVWEIMPWKFIESKWNLCWVIKLTSPSGSNYVQTNSSGTIYVFNEHKDIALTSSTGSNYILNEHEDLTILTNMAICNTIPDKWIQMESLWSYHVNELIWH